jgi:hypothetical protein
MHLITQKEQSSPFPFRKRQQLTDALIAEARRQVSEVYIRTIHDALSVFAFHGDRERAESAIQMGADPNFPIEENNRALHWAARGDHGEMILYLVRQGGAALTPRNANGDTPSHCAAYGHLQAMLAFATLGADLTLTNNQNKTPLFLMWQAFRSCHVMESDRSAWRDLIGKLGGEKDKGQNFSSLLVFSENKPSSLSPSRKRVFRSKVSSFQVAH